MAHLCLKSHLSASPGTVMTAKKKPAKKPPTKHARQRHDLRDTFIREYLIDLNATAAYRVARYKVTNR